MSEQSNQIDNNLIIKAQKDFLAKEKLFHMFRPKIRLMAMDICKRPLYWDNDDELSISLIAFNEAIETFDETKGMSFTNYSRMLIHRRLIDHFRKESRFQHLPLEYNEEENEISKHEINEAVAQHQKEERARDQKEMMELYNNTLSEFGVSIDDLLAVSPKHKDTKINLMKIAQTLTLNSELIDKLYATKKLPIKELMLITGNSKKVLEKGRKYIIAVTLILSNDEFTPIKNLIRFPIEEGGEAK
ncbi:MAG: sigma-70 family RNA polymerase sigma factor [Bacillota bacterium]